MDLTPLMDELIQEHGIDGALAIATERKISAQQNGDKYELSIWREIKGKLLDHQNLTETGLAH